MRKFKHRKTGEIIGYQDGVVESGSFRLDMGCEPSSEFWEEIIEQPKAPKWEDLESVSGYYVSTGSNLFLCENHDPVISNRNTYPTNRNTYPTKRHAEAALAEAQLLQLRDSKFYRNGWKPDWGSDENKYTICITNSTQGLGIDNWLDYPQLFSFQDEETAQRFLNEQRELLEIWAKKFD